MDFSGTDPTLDEGSIGYDTNWHLMTVVHEGKHDNLILVLGLTIWVNHGLLPVLDRITIGLCLNMNSVLVTIIRKLNGTNCRVYDVPW